MKKYINVFQIALVFLLIVVAFLWNEKIDFRYKINDQKIANFFVTVFTIIGTIATIFYTIKQYKLSELVNRTHIKPDLLPKLCVLSMKDDERSREFAGRELYLTYPTFEHGFGLMIENIFVGTAKNIKIKWVFNKLEVEELIEGVYWLTPQENTKDLEYLGSAKLMSVKLPSEYLSCCGSKLFEKLEMKYIYNENVFNFSKTFRSKKEEEMTKKEESKYPKPRPELFLEITYTDVQDFQYHKVFKTKVTGISNAVIFEFPPWSVSPPTTI